MKLREDDIKPAGLTLLYEPDWPIDPAVEYVFRDWTLLTASLTTG